MSQTIQKLPLPAWFDPSKVTEVRRVNYEEIAKAGREWAKAMNIQPAAKDRIKVARLGIDWQYTFCNPDFELFVQGAPEDAARSCVFDLSYMNIITRRYKTMDTHQDMQVFDQIWWVDENGNYPAPGTMISVDEIKSGRWRVNPAIAWSVANGDYAGLQQDALFYAEKLAEKKILPDGKERSRYPIIVWPYHAMIGGIGHCILAGMHEIDEFATNARYSQWKPEIKGGHPLRENYSVFRPEVLEGPNGAVCQKNARFIKMLLDNDMVIEDGEAKSHCFAWSNYDLLDEVWAIDPSLLKKIYILEDCTSPVIIPGVIDFTPQADEAFERFRDAGMNIVKSTDPIESWPNSPFA